jgi:hypothetical protein
MQEADSPVWVGKEVRDIYGRRLGRAVGMVFEVGGKVSSVGVENGDLLGKIDPDRITSDGEELVVIPEWMLESRNVGLDRGGLMKRFSALALMVNEKRISERLSKDIFAKLSAIQKSHEAVLARTMTRLEDLARADLEIDDFVSLVTLQHIAGEVSSESFDFTVAECEKIKAVNGKEVLDIRRTLGMATGEQSVASPGDDMSAGSGIRGHRDEGAPPPEDSASGDGVLATSYTEMGRPGDESRMRWGGDAEKARTEPVVEPVLGHDRQTVREREASPIWNENPLEAPTRVERPGGKNSQFAPPSDHGSSFAGLAPPSTSQTQDAAGPATDGEKPPPSGTESDGEPVLGQQVSEWVFAKIVDLEALDIRPGDYRRLRSLEKKTDQSHAA